MATWMNVPKGVKAKVTISTKLVGTDESKEKPAEEYITFQESANFKVTFKGAINGNIKLEAKKKGSYKVEIEALNTIETEEYLTMLDETGSIVGIIEMSPNKEEELEIKIIPVVLKTLTPALQDTQAETIYNKAMAAKNAKNLNLTDTLNQQSLNQAGIKSMLVPNPKGAEKLVIDVTKDQWGNYYDKKENGLKNWYYGTEKDPTKRPSQYINQDGSDINVIGSVETSDSFIDKLINEYYKQHDAGRKYKGALIFVTEFIYMECDEKTGTFTPKPLTYGISRTNPIKNNGVVMFKDGLDKAYAYAHELAHMLGLEHSFIENEEEFKKTNEIISKNLNAINKNKSKIEEARTVEEKNDKIILENEESKKQLEKRNEFEKKEITKWEENVRDKTREDAGAILEKHKNKQAEVQKEIDDVDKNTNEARKNREDAISLREKGTKTNIDIQNKINIYINIKYRIKQSKSLNYMDYYIIHTYFTKQQANIIKNEINYYK